MPCKVPINEATGRLNGCVGRNLDGGSCLFKATIIVEVFTALTFMQNLLVVVY